MIDNRELQVCKVPEMKNEIINNRGSIQAISKIPSNLKEVYKTIWEIKQKAIIDAHNVIERNNELIKYSQIFSSLILP